MRWLNYNRQDQTEAAEHDRMLRKIDAWWYEFARNTERLDALFRQADQWDLPGWMKRHLQSIHPDLMWEFGPGVKGAKHRLVITPENRPDLRPMVNDMIAKAPRNSEWEYYPYRLAESVDAALATVKGRTGVDVSDVTVAVSLGDANRINLVYRRDRLPEDRELAFDAAFVATESLLGEQALDRWVGAIQVVDDLAPVEPGQRFLSLSRLKPTFVALVDGTRSQLPSLPWSAMFEDAEWAVLKLQPEEAGDYPDRSDLLTCVTCHPDLVAATFADAPFYSERFSRCSETFCYLKVDGADDAASDFQDREDMEEAVRHALEAQNLGCLIGAGTGLRYSYVELALTNVERGVAAVARAMREGRVSKRSWVQFHDADLEGEWIGVYDDSPAPPREEVER
ncbi:MAG: hypothetical protein R3C59_25665 [Planctomycetaceae bacterium]